MTKILPGTVSDTTVVLDESHFDGDVLCELLDTPCGKKAEWQAVAGCKHATTSCTKHKKQAQRKLKQGHEMTCMVCDTTGNVLDFLPL
jgi:hypothetical protein